MPKMPFCPDFSGKWYGAKMGQEFCNAPPRAGDTPEIIRMRKHGKE